MNVKHAALALFLFLPSFARAEPIPTEALNKDYTACMGGETEAQDGQRAQYCSCVRDGMKGWDFASYAQIVDEQQKSGSTQPVSPKVDELAQTCLQKVLH